MSNRRLVQRSRQSHSMTPGQRRHQAHHDEEILELPPYQKPDFPLSAQGRRALEELQNYDYSKYEKHLKESKKIITQVAGECNDRVHERLKRVERATERRHREERGDSEKTEAERNDEVYLKQLQKKAAAFTKDAEQAMRDVIDYSDELAMHESLMNDVSRAMASAPAQTARAPTRRRQRNNSEEGTDDENENEEEEENQDDEMDDPVDVPSSIDLLTGARNKYLATYQAKTMLQRYETNDYKGFKQTVHDAQNPGENVPPLPKATQWFTNNAHDEDEDEDIIIAGASTNLKCPLTLQTFKEPYSNKACKHTFEKYAIEEYFRNNAIIYQDPTSGKRGKEKQIVCPSTGCETQLKWSQFYEDEVVKSQVKRAERQAARDAADDDEDFDDDNPSSNARRTRRTDSDSEDDVHTHRVVKAKLEASRRPAVSEFEEMDLD